VYQLTIEATSGDSYVMANYLPVFVIIRQDLALWASHGVSSFLEPLMLMRHPLIVCPIVKDVKLNQILIDGGSSLNILFLKTFDQMGLSMSLLRPSRAPFHGIVPGEASTPVIQIALHMTFWT
jgi:hypothetical protein